MKKVNDKYLDENISILAMPIKTCSLLLDFFERINMEPTVRNLKTVLKTNKIILHDSGFFDNGKGVDRDIRPAEYEIISTALRDFEEKHNGHKNQSYEEAEFSRLMQTPLEELNLSGRARHCLTSGICRHYYRDSFEIDYPDLERTILLSQKELGRAPNVGELTINELRTKLQSLGLDLRPEDMQPGEWMEFLKARFIAKAKEDRRAYIVDAGKIAEERIEQNLKNSVRTTASDQLNKSSSKILRFPTVKTSSRNLKQMSDEKLLQAIVDDISMIQYLDTEFITAHKQELMKIILSNSTLDVDKRYELAEIIYNTQTKTLE